MKICLAGSSSYLSLFEEWKNCKYALESFYYIKPEQIELIKDYWEFFLLDSGAFTFMNAKKNKQIDWVEYINKYAKFINDNDIKNFFELDIDCIVGHEKVKEYRNLLETKTNKKCIPVWHKSRGLEEYKRLIKEYDYISIGGIVTKEIPSSQYSELAKLVKLAHNQNCKVHGLGFTKQKWYKEIKFDSVDSTTWNRGKFGDLYVFDNQSKKMKIYKEQGRLKNGLEANRFCLQQWIKFQKYADLYL